MSDDPLKRGWRYEQGWWPLGRRGARPLKRRILCECGMVVAFDEGAEADARAAMACHRLVKGCSDATATWANPGPGLLRRLLAWLRRR